MRDLGILSAFCLLMFFVGNHLLQITDPVESNYVLTAREMLEADDYFSPRIYGDYWYDKPILFYWELLAAFRLMGINEFSARFFPAVMGSVGIFVTYFFGKRLYDRQTGLWAAIILGTSVEYWYLSHAVITDMTLFVAVSLALICFYLGYSEKKPRYYYGAYAAAAVGVLTKGPIGFCLPGLIIVLFLLWKRDLRHLLQMRIPTGMLLFLGVVSLWYWPMYQKHGWEFISTFFGIHNVLRASVPEHPEVDVWYYYLAVFLVGFFPWALLAFPSTIRKHWKCRKEGRSPGLDDKKRFLLVWAVTVPVVFQCFATKYITYTLPYMMPIALLFALYFLDHGKAFRRMALGMIVLLNVCLFVVAIPACGKNSERDAAPALRSLCEKYDNAFVACYGTRYPTSLVFYSGILIHRTGSQKEIRLMRPQAMKWNATNVMPLLPFDELPEDRDVIALVYKKSTEGFLRLAGGQWDFLEETERFRIYVRKAEEKGVGSTEIKGDVLD